MASNPVTEAIETACVLEIESRSFDTIKAIVYPRDYFTVIDIEDGLVDYLLALIRDWL